MVKWALRKVGEDVEAGIADMVVNGREVILSSGIEITTEGVWTARVARTAKVMFRSQSAACRGVELAVWPTFEISKDDSSMKMFPSEDTRRGCEAGVGFCAFNGTSGSVTR